MLRERQNCSGRPPGKRRCIASRRPACCWTRRSRSRRAVSRRSGVSACSTSRRSRVASLRTSLGTSAMTRSGPHELTNIERCTAVTAWSHNAQFLTGCNDGEVIDTVAVRERLAAPRVVAPRSIGSNIIKVSQSAPTLCKTPARDFAAKAAPQAVARTCLRPIDLDQKFWPTSCCLRPRSADLWVRAGGRS